MTLSKINYYIMKWGKTFSPEHDKKYQLKNFIFCFHS